MEKDPVGDKFLATFATSSVTTDDVLDGGLPKSRPEAKLVAVERILLNECSNAQLLEMKNISDEKLEDQREKRDCCLKILRKHVNSIFIPRILDIWIREFLMLIKRQLKLKFAELTYELLLSALREYDSIQHKIHLHCFVKTWKTEKSILLSIWPGWKRDGKTKNYAKYLKRRNFLKCRMLMYHPTIRKVIYSACKKVPSLMVNFEKYQQMESLPLDQFLQLLLEDLSITKSIFFVGFYKDVTESLRKQNSSKEIKGRNWKKFIRLMTFVVEVQVSELMKRTIEDFLNVLQDEEKIPKIDITLINENGKFVLCPTQEEVINGYLSYINAIKSSFDEELPSLEYVLGDSSAPPFVEVQLEQSISERFERKLVHLVKNHFLEIFKYVDDMDDLFGFITRPRHIYDEVSSAATNMQYEFLIEKRTIYQTYDDILYDINVASFHFFLCRLLQANVIEYLRNLTTTYRDFHTKLIMYLHQKENERLLKSLEDIKALSETEPINPRFLVVSGKYMLALQGDVLMPAYKERVLRSYEITVMLMEWMDIEEEDRKLNTTSIMSYVAMLNTLKQFNKDYELYKAQFEDNLYNRSHELSENLEIMLPKIEMFSFMNTYDKLEVYKEDIHNIAALFKTYEDEIESINEEEALLDIPVSGFPEYDELRTTIYPMAKMISYVDLWKTMEKKWIDGTFQDLDAETVELTSNQIEKMIIHYQKAIKDLITQQTEAGNPRRITGSVDDPANLAGPLRICEKVLERVKRFNEKIIYISTFCNKYLRDGHWQEMKEITGLDLRPNAGTTLRKILNLKLEPYIHRLQLISLGATEEAKLLQAYHESQSFWETECLTLKMEKNIMILTDLDILQAKLDDHILKMQIIRGSAFAKPYADIYKQWTAKLSMMNKNVQVWEKVQAQWLYLLPILSPVEVPASLRKEKTLFKTVDLFMKNVIKEININPLVIRFAGKEKLVKDLELINQSLQTTTAGVYAYLDELRLIFTRFFLISNEELLDTLSYYNEPLQVQPHLCKFFEGLHNLKLDEKMRIVSILSAEGEEITLVTPIETTSERTETWLAQLESGMISSLNEIMKQSVNDYPINERKEWVKQWPCQIVLCVSKLYWTSYVIEKFEGNVKWRIVESELLNQLNDLVTLVQSPIPALIRQTICSLITIDVHALAVTEETFLTNIPSLNDFQWLSRMRYYWESDNLIVKIVYASVTYAYEYLGNMTRLVLTPLTDRCFHTIMGAYSAHLYSSVEGPSGTGKTETIQDLAKTLGILCIILNCSGGLDYQSMRKFFKGLITTGFWVCFDELYRAEPEVLSSMTQQISCILNASKEKVGEFEFEGTALMLNPNYYICITMGTGKQYKTDIPDNLKVHFRAVAMVVPDVATIAEIYLYSRGFTNSQELGWKLASVVSFCTMQLSSQYHYTFDLRSIKEIIFAADNLKLSFPLESEQKLISQSVRDLYFSKFLQKDIPIFENILSNLFPENMSNDFQTDDIINTAKEVCKENHLLPVDLFLEKVAQIHKMMLSWQGFMLVGEPITGKSSALFVLQKCLNKLYQMDENYQPVVSEVINPKSVTAIQLYGYFNLQTQRWIDGIVPKMLRNFAIDHNVTKELDENSTKDQDEKLTKDQDQDISKDQNLTKNQNFMKEKNIGRKWILFDGPVDSSWMENLNTVLDENKKLCLSSGETINIPSNISIVFETLDLSQASPSLVSRCGIIFMETSCLGWETIVKAWIDKNEDKWWYSHESLLIGLFDWMLDPLVNFIRIKRKRRIDPGIPNLVRSTVKIMDMFFLEIEEPTQDAKTGRAWIQGLFVYSCMWSFGSVLDDETLPAFDEFIRLLIKGHNEDYPPVKDVLPIIINLPDGLIYDNLYSLRGSYGTWKTWADIVRHIKYNTIIKIGVLLYPTVETARFMFMLRLHIQYNNPVIFVGPVGTGKTTCIQHYLIHKLSSDNYWTKRVTMTQHITAKETQEIILSHLFKYGKNHFKSPNDTQCVIFLDDVNLPAKDAYGHQPPIELLRQHIDHHNWFDLTESYPISLSNILFLCAMQPPGANRTELSPRFLAQFSIYSVNEFGEISLNKIFRSTLHTELMNQNFGQDIVGSVVAIVNSTLNIYTDVKKYILPTPAKCHYMFNLCDFAKVIQGCSLIYKDAVDSRRVMIRLWTHEILRTFYDRMVNLNEKNWLIQRISWCIKTYFKDNFENVFDNLGSLKGKKVHDTLKYLLFGSVLHPELPFKSKRYEEMTFSKFQEVAESCLAEYNKSENIKVSILLFRYALEHLSRLCRVMAMPSGNALLVGVSGLGKQSLVRLATAMIGHKFVELNTTDRYDFNVWREELKELLKKASGKYKHHVLLLNEKLMNERIFSDVDALLRDGVVPNMYTLEEKMELLEMVSRRAQGTRRTVNVDPLSLFAFFSNCCKENLHLVITMSPSQETFIRLLQNYPSLVYCCSVDWYEKWPEEALEKVALAQTGNLILEENVKHSLVDALMSIHISSRYLGKLYKEKTNRMISYPSGSYYEMVNLCVKWITKREEELQKRKQKYLAGIEKLKSASEQAIIMKQAVIDMQPELINAALRSKEMMEIIEKETIAVEIASALVKEDEIEANIKAESAQELKDDCEKDLAQIIPILESAVKALNTLKPADITLVKSMKNPPEAIKVVMAAVCVMLDIKPDRLNESSTGRKILDYWGPSKKLLSDMAFLQRLKDYDKHNIPPEIMAKIRKEYIPNPIFKPKKVKKASRAAEGLCKWILAMSNFDEVEKIVAPKRRKLEIAEKEYEATLAALEEKRAEVEALENKIAELKSALEATNEHRKALEEDCELSTIRLNRAQRLIEGLSGEEQLWLRNVENLEYSIKNVLGDVLLSSAFIAYLSSFEHSFRVGCITHWKRLFSEKNILYSKDYVFHRMMGDELKIHEWQRLGLPKDAASTDNALVIQNSLRHCVMIDPQFQANKWIRNMENKNDLQIVKPKDFNYHNVIELNITHGVPVLVENFEGKLDAFLNIVLKKEIFSNGEDMCLKIGKKTIVYDKDFRLYFTSRLNEPEFTPELSNLATIVDFTLLDEGLEEQLLGIAVSVTKPQQEKRWNQLLLAKDENKKNFLNLEDHVLTVLSSATGNILDNEAAVKALDSSKIFSSELYEKQDDLVATEKEIESERNSYMNLASYASKVYYSLKHLPALNPMYHFSLEWFITVFKSSTLSSIQESVKSLSLERLPENFLHIFYGCVCRSILDEDKMLFSFLLALTRIRSVIEITREECEYLATGGMEIGYIPDNPAKEWLSEAAWKRVYHMCNLPCFKGFLSEFKSKQSAWKSIYRSNEPQNEELPKPWNKRLTLFQKLLVIRAFQSDKIKSAMEDFIVKILGEHYLSAPSFDITKSFALSTKTSPLLLILTQGADPMLDLITFASSQDVHAELEIISLGKVQDQRLENTITLAQGKGSWICLQNCHLAGAWMLNLENIACSIPNTNTVDEGFRLWLTSFPTEEFPETIAQRSIKMAKEAPNGLKRNLLQSFIAGPIAETSFYKNYQDKDSTLRRYMFTICFFHAVVMERRKFGPIGWKESYKFNEADLHISLRQMDVLLTGCEETPHDAINYLVGECNYGGKISDEQDRRVLATILSDLINPDIELEFHPNLTTGGEPFYLPVGGSYNDYLNLIKGLPDTYGPETYGLHDNAEISGIKRDSKFISQKLVQVFIKPDRYENEDIGGYILELIETILEIPRKFKLNVVPEREKKRSSQVSQEESTDPNQNQRWTDYILQHEMERFNSLTEFIHSSLGILKTSIRAEDGMAFKMDKFASHLLMGKIPLEWTRLSYPSLKPLGSYINDLRKRLAYFQDWNDNGEPTEFWISGFFHPRSFVASALQNLSCKTEIPFNNAKYYCLSSLEDIEEPYICVYGLYLEGSRWNELSSCLEEGEKGVLYYEMPKVYLIPVDEDSETGPERYHCPVYNTPDRILPICSFRSSNFIISVDVKTKLAVGHWVKRGAALLCQKDD